MRDDNSNSAVVGDNKNYTFNYTNPFHRTYDRSFLNNRTRLCFSAGANIYRRLLTKRRRWNCLLQPHRVCAVCIEHSRCSEFKFSLGSVVVEVDSDTWAVLLLVKWKKRSDDDAV